MNRLGWTLAGLLVGSGIGFFVGAFVAGTPVVIGTEVAAIEDVDPASPAAETAGAEESDRTKTRRRISSEPTGDAAGEMTISDLRIQNDELAFVRQALVSERIRRNVAQLAADVSASEVLQLAFDEDTDVSESLWDFDTARARIVTGAGGTHEVVASGEISEVDLSTIPDGTTVLSFGPGQFRITSSLVRSSHTKDIPEWEIRGAGMDVTRLDLQGGQIRLRRTVQNLLIRDLTFVGGGRTSTTLEIDGRASIALENVAFEQWRGGGYGAPIGVSGEAYLVARGCRFDAGTGRTAGRGVCSLRGQAVALFDSCTFRDVPRVISGWDGAAAGSAVQFRDCIFVRSKLAHSPLEFPVRVRGGVVRAVDVPETDDERRKAFGLNLAAEAEGVRFESVGARSSVAHALAILRAYPDTEERRVVLLAFDRLLIGGVREFRMIVREDRKFRAMRVTVALGGEVSVRGASDRFQDRFPEVSDCLPLIQLLESADFDPATSVEEIRYTSMTFNGEPKIALHPRTSGRRVTIDAETGVDLSKSAR